MILKQSPIVLIDHFTVACLVACPLNESDVGSDLDRNLPAFLMLMMLFSC